LLLPPEVVKFLLLIYTLTDLQGIIEGGLHRPEVKTEPAKIRLESDFGGSLPQNLTDFALNAVTIVSIASLLRLLTHYSVILPYGLSIVHDNLIRRQI
jgi:hypothetical protein